MLSYFGTMYLAFEHVHVCMCLFVGLLTNVYVKMFEEIVLHFKQYDQELFVAQNAICEEVDVIALELITSCRVCCRFCCCKNCNFSAFSRKFTIYPLLQFVLVSGNILWKLRIIKHKKGFPTVPVCVCVLVGPRHPYRKGMELKYAPITNLTACVLIGPRYPYRKGMELK